MEDIYKYNPKANYHPNHGTYQQQLRGKDLTNQYIAVDQKSGFYTKFQNVFTDYVMLRAPKQRLDVWNEHPFEFWQTQLDFAVWCASSGCGISVEHLNSKIPMVQSVYRFHVYFQIRKILNELEVYLPDQDGFKKYDNRYNQDNYVRLLREFGIDNDDELSWRNQKFFSTYQPKRAEYKNTPGLSYLDENSWSRWILPKSIGLTRIGIEKLSESVRTYAYMLLSAQSSARANIIGNDSKAIDAQRIFMTSFEETIVKKVDLRDDIKRFENVLRYARSKVDFSVAEGVYMIPSDMQLHIGNDIQGFNNEILISKPGFEIGRNPTVNKQHRAYHPEKHQVVSARNFYSEKVHHPELVAQPIHYLSIEDRNKAREHEEEKIALIVVGVGLSLLGFYLFK